MKILRQLVLLIDPIDPFSSPIIYQDHQPNCLELPWIFLYVAKHKIPNQTVSYIDKSFVLSPYVWIFFTWAMMINNQTIKWRCDFRSELDPTHKKLHLWGIVYWFWWNDTHRFLSWKGTSQGWPRTNWKRALNSFTVMGIGINTTSQARGLGRVCGLVPADNIIIDVA